MRGTDMAQTPSSPDTLNDGPLPEVAVYTDGGCDPNPGPGGWGAIIRLGEREWVLSGNDPSTTNNRMELQAAAAALALLEGLLGRCRVQVYTDSQYLRRGMSEWVDGWARRGWRTRSNEPVKNQDLWRVLHRVTETHEVSWHWLKGHAGHPLNERADRLATGALRSLRRSPGAPEAGPPTDDQSPVTGDRSSVAGDDLPAVTISVKASCRGAQGPGGWGAVLRLGEQTRTLSGREPSTTANAMLIRGATKALQALKRPCQVTLYSDAKYLIQGSSLWVKGWQARGWRTREGKSVANRVAWEALLEAARPHHITWLLAGGDTMPDDLARAGDLATQASGLEREVAHGKTGTG
jgi:ribonuclease HI